MSGDHNQYQKDQFPDTTKMMHKWVGLTDKEILKLYRIVTKSAWDCFVYARVIEARLKEKNT
jgi:tetraacyldisaccharide-1-P 4'-kinase